MALYNQIIFGLLVTEIITYFALALPLPFAARRALFKFLSTSHLIAKLQYSLKILFIFVTVMFADAVQRMMKIQQEGQAAKDQSGGAAIARDLRSETDWRSRKFLSERDFYLRGAALFLSVVLFLTYSLDLELIKAQEELGALKNKTASESRKGGMSEETELRYKEQIAGLQKELDILGARVDGPGAPKK